MTTPAPDLPSRLRAALRGAGPADWARLAAGILALGAWAWGMANFARWSRTDALAWTPIWPVVAVLGVVAIVGFGWRVARGADGPVPGAGPGWPDLAVPVLLTVLAAWVNAHWMAWGNPDRVMIGADHVSFTANVAAYLRQDWTAYNTDKPVLHAMLSSWSVRWVGDTIDGTLWVSRLSIIALPALGWGMARVAAGRRVALLVGLLVLADAETWVYASQTTNYALYAAVVSATLLAMLAYGRWGGWWLALLVGACLGAALATSEKAFVTLFPAGGGLLLYRLWVAERGRRRWEWAGVCLSLVVAFGLARALAPPVTPTPIGRMMAEQRWELNLVHQYRWPEVLHPNPERPYPHADKMPSWLRSPAMDVTIAAFFTPPNQNMLTLTMDNGRVRVGEKQSSTIPPRDVLWRSNVAEFIRSRPLATTRVFLVVVGALACVLRPASRPLVVLALACLSGLAPLTLKHQERYYLHLLPLGWVLSVGGLDALARALAGPTAGLGAVARTATAFLALALGASLYQRDPHGWKDPGNLAWPSPNARQDGVAGDLAFVGRSNRALARWIVENYPRVQLNECSPEPFWLYLPLDWNVPEGRSNPLCRKGAHQRAAEGTLLVVSTHAENRTPDTVQPAVLIGAGWTVLRVAAEGKDTEPPGPSFFPSIVYLLEK